MFLTSWHIHTVEILIFGDSIEEPYNPLRAGLVPVGLITQSLSTTARPSSVTIVVMAFHQPTRQQTQRVFRPAAAEEEETHRILQPTASTVEESQTWVLFSPPTDGGTATSYLSATHNTTSTPGRSQLGDLGSVDTAGPSNSSGIQQGSARLVDIVNQQEVDDDAELDSLDSHLPEFRSRPDFFNSAQGFPLATPVLPTHDGLGSFRLDNEGMGSDVQDKLFAFEQYNPRRVKRRRASLEQAQAELEDEQQQVDKMRRIEAWRLEHSRYLLQEIQKETRRRTRSMASAPSARRLARKPEDAAVVHTVHEANTDTHDQDMAWHDQTAKDLESDHGSIWGRITRKVVRDLMGIDDKILSALFGESVPDEEILSSTLKPVPILHGNRSTETVENAADYGWQSRILERIARELGVLINRMSEHPGAFSTFARLQQTPLPYAGLPPIPETAIDNLQTSVIRDTPTIAVPEFLPTVTADLPEISTRVASQQQSDSSPTPASFTQEEWEQDLDARLVFRYLRSRFMPGYNGSGSLSGNSHLATSITPDAAARAARVRQSHPLTSRSHPSERRSFKTATPSSPILIRRASSCSSQSVRKSVRRSSCSSRHYWDIGGGSVGTGSVIAAAGPMGSWGEI